MDTPTAIERFVQCRGTGVVRFEGFERKDDRTRTYLRGFEATEGAHLLIGLCCC